MSSAGQCAGAGSGVMMLAVLGLGTDLPFRAANALKTLSVAPAALEPAASPTGA